MAAVRIQYRLRSLFLFMTAACVGIGVAARIVRFQQQARFHHGQVDRCVDEAQRMFSAGSPCPRGHWDDARRHFALACACDHAVYHPWLSLAGAQAHVAQAQLPRPMAVRAEPLRE